MGNHSLRSKGSDEPDTALALAQRIAVGCAWVGGGFSAVVCGVLLVDFARRQGTDPLESERFQILKAQLAERQAAGPQPTGRERPDLEQLKGRLLALSPEELDDDARALSVEQLKELIRHLDLVLRERYFRQRWLTNFGGWLLLGGLVVMAVAAKAASTLRRKLPMPGPAGVPVDREERAARSGRWAVAALGVLAALTAVVL
ncbi:MAG TPA: hypothetical protein EYP56_21290, partial [Planctomycetaceae bacterium]|nr:hypothetical protein [Planctomycetaceae bacterium]